MLRSILLLFLLAVPLFADAQTEPPLFETRAVWLTTAAHLDWPPYDPGRQHNVSDALLESSLRQMIQRSKAAGMNAVFFQAVARGDAMYESELLPWSNWLTGTGGQGRPGFDPLAIAVDEAHKLGMELHVWFNVFRIGDSQTKNHFQNADNPKHVIYEHPDWVQEDTDGNPWLIPSNTEARAWLVDIVMEIVNNYDIDAIHFDYIRYPSGGLPGDGTRYTEDRRGFNNIGDWRRDNVTQFVRDVYDEVLAAKPWVQVGSAPIGNYQWHDGWAAFWAWSDAFQESRKWLELGIHDYLAPQLYWDIGTSTRTDPDFDWLISDWVNGASGRPIYAGMAPYRRAEGYSDQELRRQIDSTRTAGAQGQVYFRYAHLYQYRNEITVRYQRPSLPYPMAHRIEASAPTQPENVSLTRFGSTYTLAWDASEGTATDPLGGYAVFRKLGEAPNPEEADDLYAVLGPDVTSFKETFGAVPETPYFYRVIARSRLNFVSGASEAVSTNQALPNEGTTVPTAFRIREVAPNPTQADARVTFELDAASVVKLAVYDTSGREVAVLANGWFSAGTHQATFARYGLASGVYFARITAGGQSATQSFVIAR